MIEAAAWRSLRIAGKGIVAKDLDLQVEGLSNLPELGPVILAARHYHHLYDGSAIFATIPRQVRAIVGLDWMTGGLTLTAIQRACLMAGWPVVYRGMESGSREDWLPVLRTAMRDSVEILRQGKVLLIFPEAYPVVDPHPTPRPRDLEFLPFEPGFALIARTAWRSGIPVSIVPVGFHYSCDGKWRVTMRFGAALGQKPELTTNQIVSQVQQNVEHLSRVPGLD